MAISKLSLASFNLYNLNLPGLRMYRDANGWSQEEYDKKIDWTARILREGQTDVWGLQEHWHNDALTEAVTRAGLEATHTLLMPPGHAGQKIQCAALVKSDILVGAPEWITDFPEAFLLKSSGEDEQTPSISLDVKAFSRPVLTFKIKPARSKDEIRVFVCHFKSKAPTRVDTENWYDRNEDLYKPHRTALGAAISTIRRTAEAAALHSCWTGVPAKGPTEGCIVSRRCCNCGRSGTSIIPISTRTVWKRLIIFWCQKSFMTCRATASGDLTVPRSSMTI